MHPENVIALSADENMIDVITANLTAQGSDYSRNIIVFPNRRPAHFLRKNLANRTGAAFIPPRIFSIDEFVDHIYETHMLHSSTKDNANPTSQGGFTSESEGKGIKLDTIDAVAVLYDLHKESTKRIGRDGFVQLDRFFPLGLKIYNDIEELYIEKVSLYQVKDIDQFIEGIPLQTLDRLQRLSYFYDEFYKIIEKLGYSTRSSRYRAAAGQIKTFDAGCFDKIILAGFFALTKSEIDIFKTILSWDNAYLVFKDGPGIEEKLREIGITFKPSISKPVEMEINFYSSPDSHGQVFGLSNLFKDKLDKGSQIDERSVIVVPSSDTLFPLMHNCLSLLAPESYNISIGYPIYRTPIFGFLNNLMELMISINEDKFYLPNYIKFVLHPYTKNIHLKNQPELTRIIFHTIEEELSRNRTITFLSLAEIENNEKILHSIFTKIEDLGFDITKEIISNHLHEIHQNTIGKFYFFKNIGDFAQKCAELLIYIYNNSTARLHPLFYPFSEAFLSALNKISSSRMKELSFADINGYFTFFKKYIHTCNTPFEGTPIKGLQILGFLETRNLTFENIYIIDLNEDILPVTNKDDSLVPFAVRKGLGLPTYIDSDKISEYYFETLLKGAKKAHILFIENDEMEKSRFIEKLLWERQKRDCTTDNKSYIKPIQYRVTLKNPAPKEIKKTERIIDELRDFTYAASSLDSYLRCGLKFYYNHILKIRKKQDITGEIEKSAIGIFIHNLLRKYFRNLRGKILNEKDLNIADMENLLNKLFEREFSHELSGSAYLIKKQIRSHLRDLLKNYYIPLTKECSLRILDCEYEILTKVNSYSLKGRLDSIEERDKKTVDKKTVIIDYKTSSSENYYKINFGKLDLLDRDSWQEAIGSIQLPFYMLIYSESKKVDISSLNAMFLLLGKNIISRKIELPFCDDENQIIQNYETLKAIIFRLIEEIKDPNLPFAPPVNLKRSCLFCDYKNLCGTL